MAYDEKNLTSPGNNDPKTDLENKIREESLKKGAMRAYTTSFIILVVIAIIAYTLYSREHKKLLTRMDAQKTDLSGKVSARDSMINEWIITFDEIEKNIALIKEKEKIISVNSAKAELSTDKKQQVIDDIKYINTLLEQNKKKIASLTAQLAKSGGTIKALENKVKELEFSVERSENLVADLKNELVKKNFEVTQLNEEVTGMKETIVQKDSVITTQVNELNKAFYVSGTFKELKAKGLLTKEGGFIGLGKTASLTGNFPDSLFTRTDITVLKSIPLDAKNAKLISEHPVGSYSFILEGNKFYKSLEIKDPEEFWKNSKYAVIEVTR
jgi:peptidoglycan hydrolase CwlO-like protein